MRNIRQKSELSVNKNNAIGKRRKGIGRWLLLGVGAIGAVSAVARWTANAMREKAKTPAAAPDSVESHEIASHSMDNFLMAPLPPSASSSPAAPSAQARNAAERETVPISVPLSPPPIAISNTSAIAPKQEPAVSAPQAAKAGSRKASNASRKRGKMSREYDEALAHNALPTDGREGEKLNQLNERMEAIAMSAENSARAQNDPASPAPMQANGGAAEQALSTQAEGKMAIGEELRDREFPVPAQASTAAPQRLVVDQATMPDEGLRVGGVVGTKPGDHQPVGIAPDIMDQRAETPDLVEQQR